MKIILLAIVFFCIGLVSNPIPCYSQVKGSWSIGFSIGMFTKGGVFVKYYFEDGVALEVFGGGFPHILHAGSEVSIHPFMFTPSDYRNFAVTGGYSWFESSGPYSSSNGRGINIGTEISFTTKQSQLFTEDGINENFFISIGGTYIIKQELTIHDKEGYKNLNNGQDTSQVQLNWLPFIEAGLVIYNNH